MKKSKMKVCLMVLAVLFISTALMFAGGTKEGTKAAQPKQEKTKITVWCMAFDPHVNGFTNVIEVFNKNNPDVEVTLEPQPGQPDLVSKMRSSLSSGKGAQAFTTPGTTITEWVVPGNLQALSPDVVTTEEVKKNHLPENYIQCHIDEQIWAISIPDPPGEVGLVVNVDHLKEAGLPVITKFENMDQLLSYGKKLAKYEGDKLVRGGLSFQESNDPMFFYSYIVDQGGRFWDNDAQKFTLQTPEAKKALQFFYDLFYKYKLDSTELPDTQNALTQNLTSMGFMWPEFLPFAESSYPDLNFDFIMKPAFSGNKPPVFNHTDTWNVVMPKYVQGKEREATVKFLKFLISEQGQLLFLDANPGLSPLRNLVFNNDYYKTGKGKYLAPVIAAIKAGQYRFWGPFVDADVMLYDILWPNMDACFHNQITVDACLAKMEKELNEQNARTRAKYPDAPKTIIYYDGFPKEFAF
ncbi:MAG: extracellular solute-binding protein [Spirochaetales bacterium]|nr:MAG: extracellular solute-binding protein [Spirochaetales bacterium]